MILKNLLPTDRAKAIFLGRGENLAKELETEFPGKVALSMEQTHSDKFLFINSVPEQNKVFPKIDGIFTDQKEVVLVVKGADCYPILFFHPSGIVGAVHAGRKGTQKQIVKKVLTKLKTERGLVEGWKIWLGPKICPMCYQINRETDEHYDLRAKNVEQIQSVLDGETNFALDSGFCTAHQNDWFYSYRREGTGVKMNYGLISLI